MLAYGRQRLIEIAVSLGLSPKVLLLDEPAAGVPSGESGTIIEVIERLPPDIALLIIEHDMDLVFRLAQRITVLVQGSVLVEGPPEEIAADPQVRAGLSRRTRAMTRSPPANRPRARRRLAGYGETVVLEGISLALAPGGTLAVLGPQRRRQDDVARHDHGPHDACTAAPSASPAATSPGCRPIGAPGSASALCRRSAKSFPR